MARGVNKRGNKAGSPEAARCAQSGGRALFNKLGREYMAKLGRQGGLSISKDREHMARIGRIGRLKQQRSEAGMPIAEANA